MAYTSIALAKSRKIILAHRPIPRLQSLPIALNRLLERHRIFWHLKFIFRTSNLAFEMGDILHQLQRDGSHRY